MRKLLATLGHPADEERAVVVLVQNGDRFYDSCSGEPLTEDDLRGYLAQAECYVENLREAVNSLSRPATG